jgi:superfamily II DNA/RNA helicase
MLYASTWTLFLRIRNITSKPSISFFVHQFFQDFVIWDLLRSSYWYPFLSRLVKLLEDVMDGSRILIFMDTKKGCDQITRQLRMDGWPALSIHGDKSQAERDWVLSEFKAGKSPIMTATDVAARGLGMKIKTLTTF